VNGIYASESPLIKNVLRREWGFEGLIMSDWFGTESRIPALEAGLDLEMPGPSKCRGQALVDDIQSGRIGMDVIDQRVMEVLKLVLRTSEVHSTAAEEAGEDVATNVLTRKVASESMVLLKNEGNVLPLDLKSKARIAVIGKLATEYSGGGGSASGIPQYIQHPYDCIKAMHPQPDLVTLSTGVQLHRSIPIASTKNIKAKSGKAGMDITYYNDGSEDVILTESQPHATVFMLGHVKPGLKETGFTYEMTTSLTSESSGKHTFAVTATGAFQLFVDGKEVSAKPGPQRIVSLIITGYGQW
jgi:beta-glucosidase